MNIFWENIKRYPKFLITSVTGLIVIVFGSFFKEIKKNKKNQIFFFIFFILLSTLTVNIFAAILDL
jgi:prolipoprotein diacylglyceryltransferase